MSSAEDQLAAIQREYTLVKQQCNLAMERARRWEKYVEENYNIDDYATIIGMVNTLENPKRNEDTHFRSIRRYDSNGRRLYEEALKGCELSKKYKPLLVRVDELKSLLKASKKKHKSER